MKSICILFLICLLFCSCDKPIEPTKPDFTNYRYPLEVGNKWVYQKQITFFNHRPDSLQHEVLNTTGSVVMEVISYDTLQTPDYGYGIRCVVIDSLGLMKPDTAHYYYYDTDTGLIQYSADVFENIGPVMGYTETDDFLNHHIKKIEHKALIADPKVALKYPIVLNSIWKFTNLEFLISISKKVLSYQSFGTTVGMQNCFVVEWMYTGAGIEAFDYYSNLGLMKREMTIYNVNYNYDDGDPDANVLVDVLYEYTLVDVEI